MIRQSDGPVMNDREAQVRERAYFLWEAEGRPDGRAHIHWQMAEIATALLSYISSAQTEQPRGTSALSQAGRSR